MAVSSSFRTLAGLLVAFWALPVAAQSTAADSAIPLSRGLFSAAQAARGEEIFRAVCSQCHARTMFSDMVFRRTWTGRSVFELFDLLSSTMPYDNPGGLPRREYLDVLAYIFSLNGYPAGAADLPGDAERLKRIVIDAPADSVLRRP